MKTHPRRRRCMTGTLLLLGALAVGACEQKAGGLPRPPDSAQPVAATGPHPPRLDLVIADVRRRLKAEGDAALSVRSFTVPRATEWDAMVEHYSRDLGGEWKPAGDVPPSAFAYRFAAWRATGRIFSVAFIETPDPEKPADFRLLVEATTSR